MKYASICSQSADGGDRRSRPAEPAHTLRLLDLLFAGLACGRPYGAVRRRRTPKTVRRRGAAPSAGGARPHPLLLPELLVAGQECARPDKSRRRRPPEWAGGKSLPILFWRRFPRGFPVRKMKLASSGSRQLRFRGRTPLGNGRAPGGAIGSGAGCA